MEEWLAVEGGGFVLLTCSELRYDTINKLMLTYEDVEHLYGTQASSYWGGLMRLILNQPLELEVLTMVPAKTKYGYPVMINMANYHLGFASYCMN